MDSTIPTVGKGKIKGGVIVIVVVLLLALWLGTTYNSLVSLNENINNNWAQIDTQLTRRYELIPNLLGTLKGFSKQEQVVFGDLADARSRYAGAVTPQAKAEAANQVEGALARLMVIVENYPTLQSSQAYRDLMTSLEGTENRIAVARKDYNDAVTALNTKLVRFPGGLVGSLFGVEKRVYFEKAENADSVPTVNFE